MDNHNKIINFEPIGPKSEVLKINKKFDQPIQSDTNIEVEIESDSDNE